MNSPLKVAVVTLFPELFTSFRETSFVGRAVRDGLLSLHLIPLREFGLGKHQSVDDTPYGGGSGMVMRVDCVMNAVLSAEEQLGGRAFRILMTPQGIPHSAAGARSLATRPLQVFVCGRYEGFDERLREYMDEEISVGDFVLTGGEIPAMAVIESMIRFRPGVLGNEESVREESFSPELSGGLEYPQYTRPAIYEGHPVPEVLTSGDHAKIAEYRRKASVERTRVRRPDLLLGGKAAETKQPVETKGTETKQPGERP